MYITNFNLNRITKRIDIDEQLISDIFKNIDINSCLSREESNVVPLIRPLNSVL